MIRHPPLLRQRAASEAARGFAHFEGEELAVVTSLTVSIAGAWVQLLCGQSTTGRHPPPSSTVPGSEAACRPCIRSRFGNWALATIALLRRLVLRGLGRGLLPCRPALHAGRRGGNCGGMEGRTRLCRLLHPSGPQERGEGATNGLYGVRGGTRTLPPVRIEPGSTAGSHVAVVWPPTPPKPSSGPAGGRPAVGAWSAILRTNPGPPWWSRSRLRTLAGRTCRSSRTASSRCTRCHRGIHWKYRG